jgi:RHS repeat-associated protein
MLSQLSSFRSGSMPTDKKFTGQRLDGTGLYYYNARYYDPEIGRLISPDTLVPNPTNPQAFNRYSYVLNNPLKYIDPSGHRVYINNVNVQNIYYFLQNPEYLFLISGSEVFEETVSSEVFQAYDMFRNSSGKAGNIASTLENDPLVFNINWGDTGGLPACFDPTDAGGDITLNESILGPEGIKGIAWAISHEIGHGVGRTIDKMPGTFWEEALVMQFQYQVGQTIGYDPLFWPGILSGFNSPIRSANRVVHKALKVELSDSVSKVQSRQLGKAFYNTTYWDSYVNPDGTRRTYPTSEYMEKLFSFFK